MFTWLSQGLAAMARMGGQVHVAQCIGCLADRMKKIGCEIVTDRGDYKADI